MVSACYFFPISKSSSLSPTSSTGTFNPERVSLPRYFRCHTLKIGLFPVSDRPSDKKNDKKQCFQGNSIVSAKPFTQEMSRPERKKEGSFELLKKTGIQEQPPDISKPVLGSRMSSLDHTLLLVFIFQSQKHMPMDFPFHAYAIEISWA